MNGLQITHILTLDPFVRQYYKGMASVDTNIFPYHHEDPALYIVNTDKEGGPGDHWCAVYFKKKETEFFDPFGLPPNIYGFQRLFATRAKGVNISSNTVCLQDLSSSTCGNHCIFYCLLKSRGYSMSEIIDKYDIGNMGKNDEMVTDCILQFGKWFVNKKCMYS